MKARPVVGRGPRDRRLTRDTVGLPTAPTASRRDAACHAVGTPVRPPKGRTTGTTTAAMARRSEEVGATDGVVVEPSRPDAGQMGRVTGPSVRCTLPVVMLHL